MYQTITVIVLILFIAVTFLPLAYQVYYEMITEKIKHAVNLSVKILPNCILDNEDNQRNIASGYKRSYKSPVEIDKKKLVAEFYDAMEKNMAGSELFEKMKECILLKVIVYYDRFYVADKYDRWSPPFFFTKTNGDKLYYLYSYGNVARSLEGGENSDDIYLNEIPLTEEQRNDIVIEKLNDVIESYTFEFSSGSGIKIKIFNPEKNDPEYKAHNNYFNVLDGVTFFVVYRNVNATAVNNTIFRFDKAAVSGYTME